MPKKEVKPRRAEPEIVGTVHIAAALGDMKLLEKLLGAGRTLQDRDEAGCTALHHACTCGKLSVVTYLLGEGVPVNDVSESGLTPLMCAANNGHGDIVKTLLDNGADVLAEDEDGQTATDFAHARNHNKVAATLDHAIIEHATTSDVFEAATKPDMVWLKYCVGNKKVSVNAVRPGTKTTLLMTAASSATSTRAVKYLLTHEDLDVNAQDDQGYTALHLALKCPESPPEMVQHLVDCERLRLTIPGGPHGQNVFLQAVDLNRRDVLAILCTRPSDLEPNVKDKLERRVDHIAAQNKHPDMVPYLKSLLPRGTLKLRDEEPEDLEEEA
mmetsp:Transcript_148022/g.258703  ORF Transcript_148022/g.258703 Transcript_148022/m.258703 type:complete len:327 (-) Transcript_148022:292-1272(-)